MGLFTTAIVVNLAITTKVAIIINLNLVDVIGEDECDVNEHEYFLELVADQMGKEKALALVNPPLH